MAFIQGRVGKRVIRRYRPGRNDNNSFRNKRKGSGDVRGRRTRVIGQNRNDRNDRRGLRKTKIIGKRGRRFNDRTERKGKTDKDDLDRQMRQYWIKSGAHKGT